MPLKHLLDTGWAAPKAAPTLSAATPVEAFFDPSSLARVEPAALHVVMWSATAGENLRLRVTPSGPGGAISGAHVHEDTAGAGGMAHVTVPRPWLRYAIEAEHVDGVTSISDALYVVFVEW